MKHVPQGWVVAKLVDLIQPSSEKSDPKKSRDSVYVGLEHIDKNSGKLLGCGRSSEVVSTKAVFDKGDLLYGKLRPYLNKVWVSDRSGVCSTDILVFKSSAHLSFPYLQIVLLSQPFVKYANINSTGVQHPRVHFNSMGEYEVPLPPLAEQHRIVAKIEELFSDLDTGTDALKKAKGQIGVYRKSILHSAFEGSFTAEWRKEDLRRIDSSENIIRKINDERIRKFKAALKEWESGKQIGRKPKIPLEVNQLSSRLQEDLGDLPEGWVWVKVEDVGFVQLGRQRSPSKMTGKFSQKYIRAANITERGIDFKDVLEMDFEPAEVENFKLIAGDIILTEASGSAEHVGRPAVWPKAEGIYCFQNTVIRFRATAIDVDYAFWLFLSLQKLGKFVEQSGGVGINHLSAGKFSEICIPFPSKEEQQEIVRQIESRLSEADNLEKTLDAALAQAESLRQSILKQAFEGKLVPQDPNDEPAEKLLERILAERAANAEAPKKRGRDGGGVAPAKAGGNGTPVEGGAPKPRRGRPPGKKAIAAKKRG
jgi:type I restriction enzyme, S subunit